MLSQHKENAMNTGTKLALAGMALMMSVTALPATAAPGYFSGEAYTPFMVAGRDDGAFQDEREARKSRKSSQKKDARKDEREHESGEQGYGYGYERRYPAQPEPLPNPRFDDRRRH